MIRSATLADAGPIAAIYNHYVQHTCVSFEEEPVPPEQMRARIAETLLNYPWLVYEHEGTIEGYAYAGKWNARRSYRHSVETTVYLHHAKLRGGRGSRLYVELIQLLQSGGFHVAIGGIALPNEASVALHEKLGFAKAAHYREVGRKFGGWVDVGYWQLLL